MENKIYKNAGMTLEEIFFIENSDKKYDVADNIHDNFAIYKYLAFNDIKLKEPQFIVAHAGKKSEDDKEVSWSWGHYDFKTLSGAMKYLNEFLIENQKISLNELLNKNNINAEDLKENNYMEKKETKKENNSTIYSFSPFGYEGSLITIETDLRRGIPATDIVGLADGAVKESRERMQAAIRNRGLEFPSERVLISLSPADLRKEGAGFDLPIAISVLQANDLQNGKEIKKEPMIILGELELSGNIRPVNGVHAAITTAKSAGINYALVPKQNEEEAKIAGMKVYGASTLDEAYDVTKHLEMFTENKKENTKETPKTVSFNEENLKTAKEYEKDGYLNRFNYDDLRAIEIAVAGKHNILLEGAPGCGKTLLGQFMPLITPQNTTDESMSVTRIHSLAGLTRPNQNTIKDVPFRIPHQTASIEGICGGGPQCRPGEISLAHNGILMLDEAAEFRSSVLQMLRVPLENGSITLSRAGRSTTYPAKFQLVMAANPCPCGNFGSKDRICLDSMKSIDLYYKKFSAPLLDRIEIQKFVEKPENSENKDNRKISVDDMVSNITKAFEIQRERGVYNKNLTPSQIEEYCSIDTNTRDELDKAIQKEGFSPRKISNTLKVALTIANLDGRKEINIEDMKESISLVKDIYNGSIKTDTYKHYPELPELKEKKEQKQFLENAHEAFKEDIQKNNKSNVISEKEKLLNENLSDNEKKEILQAGNKEAEVTKLINQIVNVNTNKKVRK